MGNKNKYNTLYYLSIILSVSVIVFSIFCVWLFMTTVGKPKVNGFENAQTVNVFKTMINTIPSAVYLILTALGIIVTPFLAKWRQKLRDLVEYDENGLSKTHGQFSQLSRKEREAIDRQKTLDAERILSATTFKMICHDGSQNCHEELDRLIGLQNVKDRIHEMEARMDYEKKAESDNKDKHKRRKNNRTQTLSSMHMMFYGKPGTGKTTVARIMTGLLYEYGYIRKNQCVEIDGNFFNGLSVGESSKRANMLITKSLGGVIFIDEAYALLSNGGGQEVIATIVKAMEDHRDEIVFIFAGYEKEMEKLVRSNPGIESRIKYHLHFEEYNLGELKQIFKEMAHEKNLLVSEKLLDAFSNEIMYKKSQPDFGNARTVRNMLDTIIDKHAVNLRNGSIPEADRYKLKACDF